MSRHVPGLGEISAQTYNEFPNVEQYRGIPYASIPARWRQSKLITSWPNGKHDGTKYGPISPFPKFVIGSSITQKKLPAAHGYEMDEFKCLNLNVTCPKGAEPGDRYPVAVWIHGGGNVVGLGSSAEYNCAPLVNFSVEQGKPTILVTINYRLGAFGFLASDDILQDNNAANDGGCGNYGVRDQLIAYEWVKKNIEAFGGDCSRITAVAESAGSMDTHAIMCSPLFPSTLPFSQAILQSGVVTSTVRSLKVQQAKYDKFLAYHKISAETPEKRVQALRDILSDKFCDSYVALGGPVSSWQSTLDGYFLTSRPTIQGMESQTYDRSIKRLMIGDCANEGTIFAPPVAKRNWTPEKLHAMVLENLGDEGSTKFLKAYNITSNMSDEKFKEAVMAMSSECEWSQPIEATAKSFPRETFYYHIAEGNPFEGPIKGLAGHGTDLIFMFLTYQKELPEYLQRFAEKFALYWLTYINGKNPWTPYSQEPNCHSVLMRLGPDGQCAEIAETTKPSYQNLRMIEKLRPSIEVVGGALRGEVPDM